RRADTACACLPFDRRRGVRGGFSGDRPDARLARPQTGSRRDPGDARRGIVMKETIACLGAGRMGRGIAVVFAYAGHQVSLVDFKPRDAAAFKKLSGDALNEV